MSAPPGPSLFRPEALAQLDAARQIDARLSVAPTRAWLALVAVGLLVAGAAVWSVFGRAPITVDGSGILLPPSGLVAVTSARGGTVTDVPTVDDVDPTIAGVDVAAGERLLTVRAVDGSTVDVTAPVPGTLIGRTPVAVGTALNDGAVVAQLLPRSGRTTALLFVSPLAGTAVAPGMPVQLTVSSVDPSAFGRLLGTVASVDELPYDRADFLRLAGGNTQLAAALTAAGSLRVVVALTGADTVSGYAWTSANGPPFPLAAGTAITGSVQVGERAPLSWVTGS